MTQERSLSFNDPPVVETVLTVNQVYDMPGEAGRL